MKLKIAVGRLNQVDKFTPIKVQSFDPKTPEEAMNSFKKFFTDNPDIPVPQDVELILQSGDVFTISTILSIKYFMYRDGLGLEYYAFDDTDETVLDDITLMSGVLLLDEAQKFYGFIPRGYFLRFNSEDDADPIKLFNWINSTVKMFPSSSSDPFSQTLSEVHELQSMMSGLVSKPVINRLNKIVTEFQKRFVII